MPNIITHTLFADEMLEGLQVPALSKRKRLFEAGSNGPDFLFFHNTRLSNCLKKTPLRKIGSLLHQEKINDFYHHLIQVIQEEPDEQTKLDMIAYGAGHLCHWALDSTAHPFIFYRTGDCKGKSADAHHRYESLLDAILLKLFRNETTKTYDPSQEVCNLSSKEKEAIVKIYYPISKNLFEYDIEPSMFREALYDWKVMQSIFHDPQGIKISILQKIEKITGMDHRLSGFGVPPVVVDDYDLLNLLQKTWKNPATGEVSEETFLMLFDKAKVKAACAIKLFMDALLHLEKEVDFLNFLNNRSYNCDQSTPCELQHFELVDLSL